MRTECYERDLAGNGYTVLASRRIGEYCDTEAEPLKMRLGDRDEVFWPGFALTADSDLPLRRAHRSRCGASPSRLVAREYLE